MEGFAYFPTIIYRDEQPSFIDLINSVCFPLLEEAKNNSENFGIVQTNNLINVNELEFFKNYLLSSANDIFHNQGYDTNLYNFYVSSMWAQELKTGASTDIHVHKNSQLSGWIFLETPENGSCPVFYDPRLFKEMIELEQYQPNIITNATSIVNFNNVKPGTIMFNNSWLKHQLSTNMSELPTKALHFMISYSERRDIQWNI